jgi:cyclophilin family peptidyl-prolyl cis-trans isomerase
MPTEKRERQRAGREARRAEAQAALRRRQRRRQIIALFVLLAVIFGIGFLVSRDGDGETDVAASSSGTSEDCPEPDDDVDRKTSFTEPPQLALEDGKDYVAEVCTDVGSFTIDLDEDKAPKTVNNFVFLARNRYYEGVPFHRVIPDFVVQGGDAEFAADPDKVGQGGPGYQFEDELPEAGQYAVGSVAMANSGANTNGSQFFVITGQQGVQLPPNYSLFGRVTKGMDVVRKIEADGTPEGKPKVEHRMVTVTIETKTKKG